MTTEESLKIWHKAVAETELELVATIIAEDAPVVKKAVKKKAVKKKAVKKKAVKKKVAKKASESKDDK